MFSKFKTLFPTLIFLLVVVIVSIMLLNSFQVDMNDTSGFKVLYSAIEGLDNLKKEKMKNKVESFGCGSNRGSNNLENFCQNESCNENQNNTQLGFDLF